MVSNEDEFNRSIVATARAEMAARGWSVDDLLSRLPKGMLSRRTLFRLVDTETPPDREAPLWRASYIAAVAHAFGMTPYQFIAEAEHRGALMRGEVVQRKGELPPPPGADVRATVIFLLEHPEQDVELNTRLSDSVHLGGLKGRRLADLQGTIREGRREELTAYLASLPPSNPHPKGQSGLPAVGD